jgi:hypothetical protein
VNKIISDICFRRKFRTVVMPEKVDFYHLNLRILIFAVEPVLVTNTADQLMSLLQEHWNQPLTYIPICTGD